MRHLLSAYWNPTDAVAGIHLEEMPRRVTEENTAFWKEVLVAALEQTCADKKKAARPRL